MTGLVLIVLILCAAFASPWWLLGIALLLYIEWKTESQS